MAHARLSPSSAKRWMLCPAAPRREAGMPDESSLPAMRGSNAHTALERLILGTPDIALPYPEVPEVPELTEMARQCYAYALRRQKELKPAAIRAETKVKPELFTGRTDGNGTADVIIVSNKVLEVIDLKTGGRYVDTDDPQFKIYALGALAEYADPKTGAIPFETVRLTVFQPKRPGSNSIERYIEMTPTDLLNWAMLEYVPKAAATDDPEAKGVPNDEACHFCKAWRTCPDIAEAMFMSPVNTSHDLLMSSKAIADLTPEELAALLDVAPMIKARIKDAEERAEAELKDRHPIPGWKLVRGNKRREWVDEAKVEETCKALKIPPAKFAPRKIISPAQMQKLGLKADKWQALQPLIEEKPGNICLAPASDPREDAVPRDPGFAPAIDMSFLN